MRNPNEEQQTLRRWSLLSKVAIIQIFQNYQFVLALLHFLAVSYDSVYMQRQHLRRFFISLI